MPSYIFALTANAGLAITFPSAIIWVDALHAYKAPGYSTVTPEIWNAVTRDPDYVGKELAGPDAIAFSHCHIDHFTSDIVREASALWPNAALMLPEKYFPDQIYVSGHKHTVNVNDVELKFIRTHHSTKRHHDKVHYSLLLKSNGTNIFIPADSSMSDSAMHHYAVNTDIDIAIVDYSWAMLSRGREIIENDLKPKHLIVYHLPFTEDDAFGHRKLVDDGIKEISSVDDIRVMGERFQKEIITV
ncbi:MAG: hypothetical protein Q4E57_00810 [Eubacteriales bacterium]|nr:hypothetical protein [Eubacteriales bacterium]